MAQGEIRFDGRAILVTGAGRGLGRSHALLLASRGAKVLVADNGTAMDGADANSTPAETVVAEIKQAGGEAVACAADIGTEAGANQAVAACVKAFGRIDGILHNASTCPDNMAADEVSLHDFHLVMQVNPFGGFYLTHAAWPHMVKQQYGRIVYTTSSAIYGSWGNTAYASAKSAYIGMMRCLAVEGAKNGILVNCVAPSALTRMTERLQPSPYADWFTKTMLPEKVSVGAAYLLSEDSTIRGEIFAMGGGRIARIMIAETAGVIGPGTSIEAVRDIMPEVLADTHFNYPKDLGEWSGNVTKRFGVNVSLDANTSAVKPIDRG
jgi:NAD(P)-dependent dehydrogenase (short-subunit alcohol dehydrogenase family)